MGSPPLVRSDHLDSLAAVRASRVALDGELHHFPRGGESLSQMLDDPGAVYAENLALGSNLSEALSMILISPSHLESCLHPGYTRLGLGMALRVSRSGWNVILVNVFTAGAVREGRHDRRHPG